MRYFYFLTLIIFLTRSMKVQGFNYTELRKKYILVDNARKALNLLIQFFTLLLF
jgi:hypothetical protein